MTNVPLLDFTWPFVIEVMLKFGSYCRFGRMNLRAVFAVVGKKHLVNPSRVTVEPKSEFEVPLPERCWEPIVPGPCEESVERYGYNLTENACVRFQYTGCLGNENRFMIREDCRQTCMGESHSI